MVPRSLPANHRYTRPLFYQPTIGTGLSKIREHAWFPGLSQPAMGIPDFSSTSQPSVYQTSLLPANHQYTRLLFYQPTIGIPDFSSTSQPSVYQTSLLPANHWYTRPLFYQPTIGIPDFSSTSQPLVYQTSLLPANHWYRSIQD